MAEELDLELLISVTGGLGSWQRVENDGLVYCKTDDTLDCLKDLQRFLRRDDVVRREAFFALGQYGVAKSDLVSLITTYPEDTELVYNALKVVTFLTLPLEPESENPALQVEHMTAVKEAFLARDALAVVVALVAEPLQRHAAGRQSTADANIVQLVLTFLRNLVVLPDCSPTGGSRGVHRSQLRGELLERLLDDSALELLAIMAQHTTRAPLKAEAPLLLEVFDAIFAGVDAAALLDAPPPDPTSRPAQRRRADRAQHSQIQEARAELDRQHRAFEALRHSQGPPRHPRFGGVYVRRFESGQGATLLYSNPRRDDALGPVKSHSMASKQRGVVLGAAGLDARLRGRLAAYVEQFLEGSYEVMMAVLRKELEPGLHISRRTVDDFHRFLRVTRFFTSFVRLREERRHKAEQARRKAAGGSAGADPAAEEEAASPFAAISATMGWETFFMVQMLWLGAADLPPRAPEKDWELQHASLALLKEMLVTLDVAQRTGNAADRKAADRLQRRLLHDDQKESGLLPVLARLIKTFSHKYQPVSHAGDLVEALHLVLRLLERLSRQEAGEFLVKRRAAVRARRRARLRSPSPAAAGEGPAEGDANRDAATQSPVDGAAAGAPAVAEQGEAGGSVGEAGVAAGSGQAASGEEGSVAGAGSAAGGQEAAGGPARGVQGGREGDPFEEAEDEAEEIAAAARVKEVAYDLERRVRQELAFPAVVHFYTWLLQGYATNSDFLNHCISSFLKRICDPKGLNLEPMLYQLSVLRVFERLLADAGFRTRRTAPEAAVEERVREGVAALLFVEMLFWKNARDTEAVRDQYHWQHTYGKDARAQRGHRPGALSGGDDSDAAAPAGAYARDGAGAGQRRRRSKGAAKPGSEPFTEAQKTRLVELFEEHGMHRGYMEALLSGLGGGVRKSAVHRELRAMGLKKGVLMARQRERLRELFEAHEAERDMLDRIADELPGGLKRSQVAAQLRKLGLRRPRQGKGGRAAGALAVSDAEDSASSRRDAKASSDASSDAHSNRSGAAKGPRSRSSGSSSGSSSESDSDDGQAPGQRRPPSCMHPPMLAAGAVGGEEALEDETERLLRELDEEAGATCAQGDENQAPANTLRPEESHQLARKRLLKRAGPPRAVLAPSILEELDSLVDD
ncbi:hypothetical protein WJX81_005935 [Elliptochloris bilobata]|uniref:Timeless N-terminal domain-containing protein n=1 Tax=Elliptochloris bilobata TaxID=381761 RepID=A0AAW1S7E7_9CHLO